MTTEKAILAGGCFWGVQDLIRKLPGVLSTRVGYTGGDVPNATYRNHHGHAEAIEITFDPDKISYRDLLEFFFQIHDPTTLNRQGNDVGTSYRSAIFYLSDEQKQTAEDTIADVDASGLWPGKVVTEVTPRARSGRPSPSTRTTWNATRTGTPATTSALAGSCRTAPTGLPPESWPGAGWPSRWIRLLGHGAE
jgi:peptide-methionine (S)-S-oxide reductase